MDEIKVKTARKNGDSTTISLTGYIEVGRRYSIRKHDKFVIIEDIEDTFKNMENVSDSVIASMMNNKN